MLFGIPNQERKRVMIVYDKNERPIEIGHVYGRYEDDIRVDDVVYLDDGTDVPDEVIEYLYQQYAAELYDEWYQGKVGEGDALADAYRDGDYR